MTDPSLYAPGPRRTQSNWALWALIPMVVSLILLSAGYNYGRKQPCTTSTASTFTIDAPARSYYDAPGYILTAGSEYASLTKALKLWERELGWPIPRPTLKSGLCNSSEAIACAFPSQNTIIIQDMQDADPVTILMHETGHLLGVPHIYGDDLMGTGYHAVVSQPTKFAVALARAAR